MKTAISRTADKAITAAILALLFVSIAIGSWGMFTFGQIVIGH